MFLSLQQGHISGGSYVPVALTPSRQHPFQDWGSFLPW